MADRVYEDYEPYYEWVRDEGRFTVMVPGYRRDQLKIQVTSKPALKLIGERPIFQNRWRRFNIEFPIPSNYDTDNVTATFQGGKLSVTFAKGTKPKETINPPPSQTVDEQKTAKEDTPKAKEEKAEARADEVSDQKTPQKEKEPVDETEKSKIEKTETAASIDKVAEGVRTDGSTETTEAAIPQAPKTTKDAAKSVTRSKTRLIDFTLGNQVENEALGDFARGINKWKKLVFWVLLILLVVGLGLYNRNALRSSQEEWSLEEGLLFDPY